MEIITDGIIELFGDEIVYGFRRINDYLYFTHYLEITQDHSAFIIALTMQVITLGVSFLFAYFLIKWAKIFIEWGVNKIWLR